MTERKREDPWPVVLARSEAAIRALNGSPAVDPLEAGMNREAEARARHSITGPSRYAPREPHLAPPEDEP